MSDEPGARPAVDLFGTDADEQRDAGEHRFTRLAVGRRLGCELLGASVYELAPGGATWPYHVHHANEELLVVLAGAVEVRTPAGLQTLAAGTALAFPRGAAGAHAIRNAADGPSRILLVSTMREPEIAYYPDSDRYVVFAGAPPVPGETAPLERALVAEED